DGAGAAVLAPLVELPDLVAPLVARGGSDELAVRRVIGGRVAAPVGVDVVPVVDAEGVQLLRQFQPLARNLHGRGSSVCWSRGSIRGAASAARPAAAPDFRKPWSLPIMNAVAP